jgi:hypothetical protein
MVQFNENGDINSQREDISPLDDRKKVLRIQILSDPYNYARSGSAIFLVGTDPDSTNYRGMFGGTYTFTYEIS